MGGRSAAECAAAAKGKLSTIGGNFIDGSGLYLGCFWGFSSFAVSSVGFSEIFSAGSSVVSLRASLRFSRSASQRVCSLPQVCFRTLVHGSDSGFPK